MSTVDDKTIQDFDEQWTHYADNEGWYGSLAMFSDMITPIMSTDDFKDKTVARWQR